MRTVDNKVIIKRNKTPCAPKTRAELLMTKIMFDSTDSKTVENLLTFLWRCPIKKVNQLLIPLIFLANTPILKGLSIIPSQPKAFRMPLVIPSFLTTPGTYKWSEVYKVEKGGKSDIFLTISKPLIIALD